MKTTAIVASVVVLVLLLGVLLWSNARPVDLKLYYTDIFANAQTITISRPAKLSSATPVASKTLHRRDHPDTFRMLEDSVRRGVVHDYQCQCIAHWRLTLTDGKGRTTDLTVCHYLLADGQPATHKLWFYPVAPGRGEDDPGLIEEFDALMGVRHDAAPPVPGAVPKR